MDESSLAFVKTESIGSCIIITNYCDSTSRIIWFDPFNGHPLYFGIPGFDTFPSEKDAYQSIEKLSKIESVSHAKYLIGIHKVSDFIIILTVVKEVKKIGILFGQHRVYSVGDVEYWNIILKNDIKPDYNLSEKQIINFKSYPVSNNHFFCPTFNLTSVLGDPVDNSMIWNSTLSHPFKKFGVPCCIELIQGCFRSMSINDDTTIFTILRRRCTDSGPINFSKGLSQNGSVGNEVEIEFILQNRVNGIYRTMSYFLRRCSSPVSSGNRYSCSTEESCMHAPVFLHRLVEIYRIKKIALVDLSHSQPEKLHNDTSNASDNLKGEETTISAVLKKVVSFISKMFDVNLFQFDWTNQCQIDVFRAVDELLSLIAPITDQIGVNDAVWVNNIPNFSKKQNGFCVLSCQTGFDQTSIASYIIGLYSFAIMFNEIHFISNLPQKFQSLKQLNQDLSLFLGNFFLLSGRIIGQIYCGSSFFNERELISLADLKVDSVFSFDQIKEKRKKFNQNYDNFLFSTEFKNESENALSFCSNDCVSVYPGAQIISPSHHLYPIFSFNQNSLCSIKCDSPVILSLSRPCQISQIVFKIKNQAGKKNINLKTPSSVSIFGGMYLNRLFPLFEDFSFIHSDDSKYLKLSNHLQNSYDTEIYLNCIEKVRYVQFWFKSTSENVTISNIYIFGNVEIANLCTQSFSQPVSQNVSLPPPIESATFPETVSADSIIKWEERRLCANMTFNSFLKPMIERGLNPFHMTLSHIMNLNGSVLNNNKNSFSSKFCSTCRSRPATFQCGMCGKLYCSMCTNAAEVKEVKEGNGNKLIVAKICETCFSSRTDYAKIIPRFELLKKQTIKNNYPFVGNYTEFFDGKTFRNYENNLIGAIFISEPPVDRNGCFLAENILDINNTIEWSPVESVVTISVLLKQRTELQKIAIRCNSPLKLLLNDNEYIFSPPMTEQSIDSNNIASVLHITLIGLPIKIESLSFYGQPSLFSPIVKQSIVRKDEKVDEIQSLNSKFFLEEDRIHFSFGKHALLYGVYFEIITGDQEIVFEIKCDNKKVIVPLQLPCGRFTKCVVEMPVYYKTKSFNLWFSTSVQPLRNRTIIPLNVSNAKNY